MKTQIFANGNLEILKDKNIVHEIDDFIPKLINTKEASFLKSLEIRKTKIKEFTFKHLYNSANSLDSTNFSNFTKNFPEYQSLYLNPIEINSHQIDFFFQEVFSNDNIIALGAIIGIRHFLSKFSNISLEYFHKLNEAKFLENLINLALNTTYEPFIFETLSLCIILSYHSYSKHCDSDYIKIISSLIFDIYSREIDIFVHSSVNNLAYNFALENLGNNLSLLIEKKIIQLQIEFIKNYSFFKKEIILSLDFIKLIVFNANDNEIQDINLLADILTSEFNLSYFYLEKNKIYNLTHLNLEKIFSLEQNTNKNFDAIEYEIYKLEILLEILYLSLKKNRNCMVHIFKNTFKFLKQLENLIKYTNLEYKIRLFSLKIIELFINDDFLIESQSIELLSKGIFYSLIKIIENNQEKLILTENNDCFFKQTFFMLSNLFTDQIYITEFLSQEKENDYLILTQLFDVFYDSNKNSIILEILFILGNLIIFGDCSLLKFLFDKDYIFFLSKSLVCKNNEFSKVSLASLVSLFQNKDLKSFDLLELLFEKIKKTDLINKLEDCICHKIDRNQCEMAQEVIQLIDILEDEISSTFNEKINKNNLNEGFILDKPSNNISQNKITEHSDEFFRESDETNENYSKLEIYDNDKSDYFGELDGNEFDVDFIKCDNYMLFKEIDISFEKEYNENANLSFLINKNN